MFGFKTWGQNEDEFKMVVFNDIHDRPQIIPQLLYRHGYTGNTRDYDFVVFNGDCFDWVTEEQQMVDHLIKPSSGHFCQRIPSCSRRATTNAGEAFPVISLSTMPILKTNIISHSPAGQCAL